MTAALVSPTKIFDYFAAGLPVIAPSMPSITDFVCQMKQGILYTPGCTESLASAIHELFLDPVRYISMQEQCIKAALRYSWKNRAQNIIGFTQG